MVVQQEQQDQDEISSWSKNSQLSTTGKCIHYYRTKYQWITSDYHFDL